MFLFPGMYRFFVSLDTWGVIEWCWCPTAAWNNLTFRRLTGDLSSQHTRTKAETNASSVWKWTLPPVKLIEVIIIASCFPSDVIFLLTTLILRLYSGPSNPPPLPHTLLPCHRRSLVSKHGFWHFTMFALPSSLHTARMISSNVHTW